MRHSDKPLLTPEQFDLEFKAACSGLEKKHNWVVNTIQDKWIDGRRYILFDTLNIGEIVALPFTDFIETAHECFYDSGKTFCDELHNFLTFAKKEVETRKQQ